MYQLIFQQHLNLTNMNSLAFVVFFAAVAASYAAPSATIIQGPSAKSTLVGSDGSIISSVAPGGQIVAEEYSGVVAHTAPVHAVPAVYSTYAHAPAVVSSYQAYAHAPAVVSSYHAAPVVAHAAPVLAHAAPVYGVHSAYSAYSAPVVAHAAPVVASHGIENTVIAGPSGTIATSKTVAAPTVVAAYGVHNVAAHGYGHGLVY